MLKNDISVVIPTFNCKDKLKGCLDTVSWAKEIIIVDMGSTDGTLDLVKKYGAKVFLRPYPKDGNFDWNRLFGMRKARSNWILKIDSDERLSESLQEELAKFSIDKVKNDNISGVYLRNRIFFLGKEIRHGPVEPDSKELRLVKKNRWKYYPFRYHQQIIVTGKTLISSGYYVHYNYQSVKEFIDKTNRYTELDSISLASKQKVSIFLLLFVFFWYIVKYYLLRRGFLDGRIGVVSCFLFALYYFIEKIKIFEKQRYL